MTEGNWTKSPTVLGRFFEIFLERTALFLRPKYELFVNNEVVFTNVDTTSERGDTNVYRNIDVRTLFCQSCR